jgi:uncharacterized membrane protein YsdA (DUF1294 family)
MRGPNLPPFALYSLIATVVVGAAVGLALALGVSPFWGYLAGINLSAVGLYGYDKWAAGAERLRVPELVLHLLALLGGSPAAFAAQSLFRHKTVKRPFRVVFWLIVVAQIAVIGTAMEWRAKPPAWLPPGVKSVLQTR